MQINANPVRIPVLSREKVDTPKTAPASGEGKELDLAASASLDESLRNAPDVRHAEIERATRLVQTGGYPPPELIRKLSRLLADEINQTGSESSST
ncbi:MAG: hypothetical protein HYR88_18810 [Verrucomicrobia bacterium]|nr:hypothetical protein [Verrucomicrobiota bacterium]MBI3870726.1 hypothetical protein [Verrucomicrobiota bacterium]